jgi:hypothetical protein
LQFALLSDIDGEDGGGISAFNGQLYGPVFYSRYNFFFVPGNNNTKHQKWIYSTEFRFKTLNKLFLGGNFD